MATIVLQIGKYTCPCSVLVTHLRLSWEPEENVIDCKRLLKSFWQEFKLTYKRGKSIGEVGKTYTPSDAWIGMRVVYL